MDGLQCAYDVVHEVYVSSTNARHKRSNGQYS
jgi:hypothetical protein